MVNLVINHRLSICSRNVLECLIYDLFAYHDMLPSDSGQPSLHLFWLSMHIFSLRSTARALVTLRLVLSVCVFHHSLASQTIIISICVQLLIKFKEHIHYWYLM